MNAGKVVNKTPRDDDKALSAPNDDTPKKTKAEKKAEAAERKQQEADIALAAKGGGKGKKGKGKDGEKRYCFAFQRGECKKSDCGFLHEKDPNPKPPRAATPPPGTNSANKICHFFKKGKCRSGAACPFSHEIVYCNSRRHLRRRSSRSALEISFQERCCAEEV